MKTFFHFFGMLVCIILVIGAIITPILGMFIVMGVTVEFLNDKDYSGFTCVGILVSVLLCQFGLSLMVLSIGA